MFQVEQIENAVWDPISFTVESGITVILSDEKEALTELAGYLAGCRVAKKGTVKVNGQEADGTKVGYMPAQVPVYEDMKIGQWLEFMASLKGLDAAQAGQQVKDLMEKYGNPELADRVLSKKMNVYDRKLAVLLQALTGDPQILVLDQPADGLTEENVQELYDLIQKIADDYPVIMLLTDPNTAEMAGGQLMLFHDGIMNPVTVEELHTQHGELYQEMVKEQLREDEDLSQILEDYEGGSQSEEPHNEK